MSKATAKNVRIKHAYLAYLEAARGKSPATAEAAAAAISLFEESTNHKDFAAFHIEQAKRFRRYLEQARHARTGEPLSKATIHSRLSAVKAFFVWLADRPGYKSRISYSDCDYFNPPANDVCIADAKREREVPTLDQIRCALAAMPHDTDTEKRDRALFAFAILSGARDNAIASFNVGHIDLDRRTIHHDARTVRTKNRKTITTTFFPVGTDIEAIVAEWITFLRTDRLFAETDPLFPATRVVVSDRGSFEARGLMREHWTTADPIRKTFREAFERVGLPYFNPHSFRSTLARLGERICRTPEDMKAWSQNLGHDDLLTTFTSYGEVPNHRQSEILNGFLAPTKDRKPPSDDPTEEAAARILERMKKMLKVEE